MSKTNYSNFSKPSVEAKDEIDVAVDVENVENVEPEVAPEVENVDVVEPEEPSKPQESRVGVVVSCLKLRVRKAPSLTAEVLCEIEKSSAVVIDPANSTKDFFKVCTEDGVEGYCMKKFINVRS